MSKNISIENISNLVQTKAEGAWYDFKRQWHDNNETLLHDILCMANLVDSHDRLIIIGIDEEKDYSFSDISKDPRRKNTQKITDFLSSKKFAGGFRPIVSVSQLHITEDILIDVIEIKGTRDVPYFLLEDYGKVKAGHVYVRIQDTNTPLDKTADMPVVENLWKHHFSLNLAPYEHFCELLNDDEGWRKSPEYELVEKEYYAQYPWFTIEHIADESRNSPEFYCFNQCDSSPYWFNIIIRYHQTVLANELGIGLDGCRYFTPVPERDFLHFDCKLNPNYSYVYFVADSSLFRLYKHFYRRKSDDETIAHDRFVGLVLFFKTENEHLRFHQFIQENGNRFNEIFENSKGFHIDEEVQGRNIYLRDLRAAVVLKRLLELFQCANDIKSMDADSIFEEYKLQHAL